MKLAITGKGGTGKTTVAGLLAYYLKRDGYNVLAVDADPDSNLATALGIPEEQVRSIIPISKHRQLIRQRTGAKASQFGQLFKINPEVRDIPEKFCTNFKGIKLLVMGGVQKGGEGCACPENVLLRRLLSEIILHRSEAVVVDMEAGIEHLGRATSGAIDEMIIVVEPGSRSVLTAETIMKLAKEIGVSSFGIIGNKIQSAQQKLWIEKQFSSELILGTISYSEAVQDADLNQSSLFQVMDERLRKEFDKIYQACMSRLSAG